MRKISLYFIILFVFFIKGTAQDNPAIAEIDRIRIAEAFRVGEKIQNKVWKDWSTAPFSMLLVTKDREFLIRHPKPSDEFQSIGYDALLKSEVFVRPRKFPASFLATFPAFNHGPVIVVGQAENTQAKTSTTWLFTVLHEHFHQLQYSRPSYYADVNALGLARGDETGMWQINFPFPYKKAEVREKFDVLSKLLVDAYNATNKAERSQKLAAYMKERKAFESMLSPDDYKYLSFQLWQEGMAQYTQYRTAEYAARKVKPGKDFLALKDFSTFDAEADRLLKMTFAELKDINLAEYERTAFYPFGAVEGLVLDKVDPKWRVKYFENKFALEKNYPKQVKK